jgi:hypothetical protein
LPHHGPSGYSCGAEPSSPGPTPILGLCGNAGSLHHWICRCHPDGIDPARGNRFFFEEASHLRRLGTEDVVGVFAPLGFVLEGEAYSCQFWGGLRLISESSPAMILELLHPLRCHRRRAPVVAVLLASMLLVWGLRAPVQVVGRCRRMLVQCLRYRTRRWLSGRSLMLLALALPALLAWLPSRAVDGLVR